MKKYELALETEKENLIIKALERMFFMKFATVRPGEKRVPATEVEYLARKAMESILSVIEEQQ